MLACFLRTHLLLTLFDLLSVQPDLSSADAICDSKIREWLANRKKHAASKRKRTSSWISKLNNTQSKTNKSKCTCCNTPKRITRSKARSRHVIDETAYANSPVAPSMVTTPVVKHVIKKRKQPKKQQQKVTQQARPLVRVCLQLHLLPVFARLLFACLFVLFA